MKKIIGIRLSDKYRSIPSQYEEFHRYTKFYSNANDEIIGNTIYFEYDPENACAQYMLNNLDFYLGEGYLIEDSIEKLPDLNFKRKKTEVRLPIDTNINITAFPYISMFLPIVKLNKKMAGWLYSNFINIFCVEGWFYTYTDDRQFFKKIFEENNLTFLKFIHFDKELFIKSLNESFYIYVWIDSFSLGGWGGDTMSHDAHPMLIYGYNLNRNIYYCFRFDVLKGFFLCEYDMETINKAIEDARMYIGEQLDDIHISFVKLKEFNADFLFDSKRFLKELKDYTFSTGDRTAQLFRSIFVTNIHDKITFGLDVTRMLKGLFQQNENIPGFDYRLIHLITENKKLIAERLEYVSKNNFPYFLNMLYKNKIIEYKKIITQYEILRNKFIKQSKLETNGKTSFNPPRDPVFITKISEQYDSMAEKEYVVLKELCPILEDALSGDIFCSNPNESYCAEKTSYKDEIGRYIMLSWENAINSNRILIVNPINTDAELISGTLIFSDGSVFNTPASFTMDTYHEIKFEIKKISWLKFYPKKYLMDDKKKILIKIDVYGRGYNLFATYVTASTVYAEFFPVNLLEDTPNFWCPDFDEKEPYIEIKFDNLIQFNYCVIKQDVSANRISGFRLEYFTDTWETAYKTSGELIGVSHY
jgi:hypothetical protein